MAKFNSENERIKRRYLEWEREANGKSNSTIENIRNYIYLYDEFTKFKNFKLFNKNDAIAFKKHLAQKKARYSNQPVSKIYLFHAVKSVGNCLKWLYTQPGYRSKIDLTQVAYLNLQEKDVQIARTVKTKRFPTLEQIESVVKNMPADTEVQKRDRALIAFLALSGGRVTAIVSLKLKHIFLDDERIEQHPQEVKTKYSKKIITYFFPVGDFLKKIFIDWVNFLKQEKLFDHNAPLFSNTKLSLDGNDQFSRQGLDSIPWKSTTSIRTIIKESFNAAGLEYYNPHSFRNTVVQLGYKFCKTPEEFKAWSQNLGHSSPLTTFTSYGHIEEYNQGAIIKRLGKDDVDKPLTMNNLRQILLQNKIIHQN